MNYASFSFGLKVMQRQSSSLFFSPSFSFSLLSSSLFFLKVLLLFRYRRPTDQEMTVSEKIVCYPRRVLAVPLRYLGGTRVSQEAERERGKHGQKPLLWFL